MLVEIPSMMNLDMRDLALISVTMICTLANPLQISESKRRAAELFKLVGIWRMIVFFPVALANVKWNCLFRDSLIERILSRMVPGGTDSTVQMTTSDWIGGMAVLKRAASFAFFCFVTVWKGVSAPFAAAAAYDGAFELWVLPFGQELLLIGVGGRALVVVVVVVVVVVAWSGRVGGGVLLAKLVGDLAVDGGNSCF